MNGNYAADYKLEVSNVTNGNVQITDSAGHSLITGSQVENNVHSYVFKLGANQKCYFNFAQADGRAIAKLAIDNTNCRWIINGETIGGYSIRLKPNASYNIRAEYSVDGSTFIVATKYSIQTSTSNCSFSNNVLQIGNVTNSTEITIIPKETTEHRLIVVVDDMITKIRLNHESGSGYNGEISVELNKRIPSDNISVPQRAGYRFLGYYNVQQGSSTNARQYITENMEGLVWDIDVDNITLYAHWERIVYTLTFVNADNKHSRRSLYYGDAMPTLDFAPAREGYNFLGYYTQQNGGGSKYYTVTDELADDRQAADNYGYDHYYKEGIRFCYGESRWMYTENMTLYSHWKLMETTYYYPHIIEGVGTTTSSRLWLHHGQAQTITVPEIQDGDFKHFTLDGNILSGSTITWTPSLTLNAATGEIIPTESLAAVYTPKQCIAEGTLITLADGRKVPVESLKGDEMLLVWNLQTGQFDSAWILFIDKDSPMTYKVINLNFSDGTNLKVIAEHALWDYDLNKYVYLDKDASQYIGHWFNKQTTDIEGNSCNSKVQLVSVEIKEEYTTAYSPVTYSHLCYYVNGMLSMPGGINGLFNIFDVDPKTMTINKQAMEKDLETYGVYTYKEFSAQFPVTEEVFEAFNGQYLKVAIGKGMIDMETIHTLIVRYAKFFN